MNFKLFADKNLRRIIIGQIISGFGSNIQQFALSLFVLEITKSATLFASMLAISAIPRIIFSPFAGVMGDWFDRKKSLILYDSIDCIVTALFAVHYFIFNEISIPFIIFLVVLLEVVEIFYGASMSAVIPSMVEKDKLFEVNSLRQTLGGFTSLLAPLAATALFAGLGLFYILAINSVSFLIAIFLEIRCQVPKSHTKPDKINVSNFIRDLSEGVSLVWRSKAFQYIVILGIVLNFFLAPIFNIGLMYIVKVKLFATDMQFGLFGTIFGVSMILGPMLLSKYCKKNNIGKTIKGTFRIISISLILLALFTSGQFIGAFSSNVIPLLSILAMSFVMGMVTALANISVATVFDTYIPHKFMGRTSSFMNMLLMIAMPFGQITMGYFFDVVDSLYLLSVVGVIVGVSSIYIGNKIMKLDKIDMENPEDAIA